MGCDSTNTHCAHKKHAIVAICRWIFAACLAIVAGLSCAPAIAQMSARHIDRPWFYSLRVPPLQGVPFDDSEAATIRRYFADHPGVPDPASAHDARALRRGARLPSTAPRKNAPAELVAALRAREGYEVLIVGRDVVLFATRRAVIIDVLRDAM